MAHNGPEAPDGQPDWGGDVPQWQDSNRATTALVFGILGVVGCWLLAPFAWWLGRKELFAIEAGIRSPTHRRNAKTGKVLGMVGTAVFVLVVPLAAVVAINAARDGALRDDDGSVRRTATVLMNDLRVGDCGDWPPGEIAFSVTVHPCDVPHDFEMYATVTLPDGPDEPYRQESIQAWSIQACFEEFEPYVGVGYDESPTLSISYIYPREASWRDGDRIVQCVLQPADEGGQMTGSKKGSDLDDGA